MAISYPLTVPSHNFRRLVMRANTQVSVTRSPYTLRDQVQDFAGQLWVAEVTLPTLKRIPEGDEDSAEDWTAFFLKLNGPKGTFLMGDPSKKTPRGSWAGAPVTNGANQYGTTLDVSGFTPDEVGVAKAGDHFQIGYNLYCNLNDVDADGSGEATLDIWPRVRATYANGTALVTSSPKGTWRLVEPDIPLYNVDEAKNYDISFTCAETF